MSYFTLEDMDKEKKRDHRNERNPHYNKPHSSEAKKAISKKQSLRYEAIRQLVERGKNPITEERVKQIIKETLQDYQKRDLYNKEKISL